MSGKGSRARKRRFVVLMGAGLLLAQSVCAGQSARVHFDYDQDDKKDLCLVWDQGEPGITTDRVHLAGSLYYRKGSQCPPADGRKASSAIVRDPAPVGQAPEPLADQTIRIRYRPQGSQTSSRKAQALSVTTDTRGRFHVALPAPALAGGMRATAAWYGPHNDQERPWAQDEKRLLTHLDVDVLNHDGVKIDPDKQPEGPRGRYRLDVRLVSWNGAQLKSSFRPYLKEVAKVRQPHAAMLPASRTGFVQRLAEKKVAIRALSVTGKGALPALVPIQAVVGAIESDPVWLPFGVEAHLRRVGPHKDEEILLQRPKGYNGNEGKEREFLMDEHAELELELRSQLSGDPLDHMPVTWRVDRDGQQTRRITAFLSDRVDVPEVSATETGPDGRVRMAVSARHLEPDAGSANKAPSGTAYQPAAGVVPIEAHVRGQIIEVKVPFIDSLWVMARPDAATQAMLEHWRVGDVQHFVMQAYAYMGTQRWQPAKRPLLPFDPDDHAVAADSTDADPDSAGPVVMIDSKGTATPSDRAGHPFFMAGGPGLAYRPDTGGPYQLTGYFRANKAGPFCLVQQWEPLPKGKGWWGQAGVKIDLPDYVCGTVTDEPTTVSG